MSIAFDILIWLLIGLGILFLLVIWGVIVAVCVQTVMRFGKAYRKASAEIDAEEAEQNQPPHYF
ncbi:hypothetical protein SEA_OHMYWARD_48 [Gordonia phage OhMyWard]|uniref:Uncharacterized protein n=1 Tax=Gordonia phage OhMyWard TaxID=2652414 RepID=A0A5P8DA03_9CAUD|nr:hypothetical protein HWC72_gp48 [Gordonia phage OhMyWard]QFP94930.1 hypothetical protein SEA_OHMYWARD_48 [Gordonia phage OhMyWard]